MALQRGLDEGHGSRAVDSSRKILFDTGSFPMRDDGIGEVPVQITERFVVTLRVARREAAGAFRRLAEVGLPAPQRP